jgi:hypothetical protein
LLFGAMHQYEAMNAPYWCEKQGGVVGNKAAKPVIYSVKPLWPTGMIIALGVMYIIFFNL